MRLTKEPRERGEEWYDPEHLGFIEKALVAISIIGIIMVILITIGFGDWVINYFS
jgi:hypothetical protein